MHRFLTSPSRPDAAGSRLASRIWSTPPESAAVALIGLPDDTGVAMNGGRIGAAEGPAAFRSALARYGVAEPGDFTWPIVCDLGDVAPGDSLVETHDRVSAVVEAVAGRGLFPIGIGGGHDLTFAFVRGVSRVTALAHGVYFDAHLDVRAEDGSGMPFRRLVEQCDVRSLHVHGLDRYANAKEHVDWFDAHGGDVDAFEPDGRWPAGPTFASFDLDVVDAAHAPGVSAINPAGWTPALAERWTRAAGRNSAVRCFDIMELNPRHDEGGRTARLAVRLLLAFLRGFAERST